GKASWPALYRLRTRQDLRGCRGSPYRRHRAVPGGNAGAIHDRTRRASRGILRTDRARHDLTGTRLVDAKKRHGALVRADGAIMLGDKVGSIHRMGAVAQGSEACNGWTFWHVETKK